MDQQELADAAYACNKISKYLDDADKEIRKAGDLAEKAACALWASQSPDGAPIRTPYVTATPDVKMCARIPHRERDPEAYSALMEHLGVPLSVVTGEYEVLRPHWPGFVAHISKMQEDGLPLPPGVDPNGAYPIYSLKMRGLKEVDAPA